MRQYLITPASTNKALLGAVCLALSIITRRAFWAGLKAVRTAKTWLNAKHAFCKDADDPAGIVLTGWQYVGLNAMACVAMLVIAMVGD